MQERLHRTIGEINCTSDPAKGHIVAFTATFAYVHEAINILQHNLRRTVHAPRDDVSPRASGLAWNACQLDPAGSTRSRARARARALCGAFETLAEFPNREEPVRVRI